MSKNEVAGLDWAANRLVPGFQTPQQLEVYDIRGASREAQLTITTLAGLINRPQPRVYLLATPQDDFWLKTAFPHVQHEYATAKGNDVLDAMLIKYRDSVQGMIIYNSDFPDSINIATTLAGQRDGIIVSPAQAQALQTPFKLASLFDLNQFEWKTRFQAYKWAYENLLDASSSRLIAGLDPGGNSTSSSPGAIPLRSFLVATRTFVYWLDSRDILPDITDLLSSEHKLMQQIFSKFPAGSAHLGWFINEQTGVSLTSESAITVLASDFFSNLEVFAAMPVVPLPPPASVPTPRTPQAEKIYVSFTMSDGDNLQYSERRLQQLWNDGARGSIPIGWTVSPVLIQAAPSLATYYASTATANDELIAGPSGAGYMYPSLWPPQNLPAFLEQTGQLMQQMNLSLLEVLDSTVLGSNVLQIVEGIAGGVSQQISQLFSNEQLQQQFVQALAPYGVRGLLSGSGTKQPQWELLADTPIYRNLGPASNVSQTVSMIRDAASNMQRPLFLSVYVVAWSMTPGDLKQVVQQLGSDYEIVTPGTLLAMIRQNS